MIKLNGKILQVLWDTWETIFSSLILIFMWIKWKDDKKFCLCHHNIVCLDHAILLQKALCSKRVWTRDVGVMMIYVTISPMDNNIKK